MTNSIVRFVRTDDRAEVFLPMPSPYVPIPPVALVAGFAEFRISSAMVYWLGADPKMFRTEPPPRALFRIQPQQLRMELVDPKSGQTTVAEWPRQRIVELRNNRYEKGLWIHVQGETKRTVLREVDDETMIVLCGTVQSFLASDEM